MLTLSKTAMRAAAKKTWEATQATKKAAGDAKSKPGVVAKKKNSSIYKPKKR